MSTLFEKLKETTEPLIRDFVKETLADLSDGAKAYGKDLAQDFTKCLWTAWKDNDPEAKQNLEHLKVQAAQLAMIHRLRINKRTQALLEKGLAVALKVGLAALAA